MRISEIIFGGGGIRTDFFTPRKCRFKIKYRKIHSKHVYNMDLRADQFAPEKQGFVRNGRLLRVEIDIVTRPTYVCSFSNQVREIIQQSNMKFSGTLKYTLQTLGP